MNLQSAVLAAALGSMVSVSLGGTETNVRPEVADETAEDEWECSLSISTYLVENGRDYANPNLVADRDWLHLEARYNYEAIKTGSLWLGYNFSVGRKLAPGIDQRYRFCIALKSYRHTEDVPVRILLLEMLCDFRP